MYKIYYYYYHYQVHSVKCKIIIKWDSLYIIGINMIYTLLCMIIMCSSIYYTTFIPTDNNK
jgi:hypothetical protein